MKRPKGLENCVTDHAVVRYIERILGLDIDGVRREIASGHEEAIAKTTKGVIKVPGRNMNLTIRSGVVVTVTAIRSK